MTEKLRDNGRELSAVLHSEKTARKNMIATTKGIIFICEPFNAALAESFILEFIQSPKEKVGKISLPDYFLQFMLFYSFFCGTDTKE